MYTDLVLCDQITEGLGFDRVMQVKPLEFRHRKDLERALDKELGLRVVFGSTQNRTLSEIRKIDILLSPERNVKRDSLHFRNSGLDHVICDLLRKNDIAVGFNFNEILTSHGIKRAAVLGRMAQNVNFCRKYHLKMVLASFAKNRWQMRSRTDLTSFGVVLGMHPGEAQQALRAASEIMRGRKQ